MKTAQTVRQLRRHVYAVRLAAVRATVIKDLSSSWRVGRTGLSRTEYSTHIAEPARALTLLLLLLLRTTEHHLQPFSMEGYDVLCAHMSTYPDLAIFRRFSILSYRDLLLMQAELMEKESLLLPIIADDRESNIPLRQSFAVDFEAMMNDTTEGGRRQRELMLEIRPLLRCYSVFMKSPKRSHSVGALYVQAADLLPCTIKCKLSSKCGKSGICPRCVSRTSRASVQS
jgi:hypothetical protein